VRDVIGAVADDGEILEVRPTWAPQLVTALTSIGGMPVGVVANQPRAMAGTLDIPASQKGARFVRFCDAFNLPLLTAVDTPGFLPGKDLEWRGMIRHGAELAFAFAEASVPRVCLVLRKAFGGAYIVMDSKGMGNDVCLAWPSAEIAVMGAGGAAQILARGASAEDRLRLEERYRAELLTPWVAAERGYVDEVIDPADTRRALHRALTTVVTRRELLPDRKHDAGPM
jgi:acetyl-CoA carboxylase carboxyltransferase component